MSQNGIVLNGDCEARVQGGFVEATTRHLMVNGKPLYCNGFNAYWLMCMASDPSTKTKVTDAFQQASKIGMNMVRTWAFSDGGSKPLQTSPGVYNEDMFKGLDFMISEAKKHKLHLIVSLVNNWDDFGGKKQYVQWARDHGGQYLILQESFEGKYSLYIFVQHVPLQLYSYLVANSKHVVKYVHIKNVLTRRNSITGVTYKDDPTIFAWELINEPRCQSDLSGKMFQKWVVEMAAVIKSIDKNHLVEIGLEGFYGESMPDKKQINPGYEVGTDFILNNRVNNVDFATIHLYPDQWVLGASDEARAKFVERWVKAHIEYCKVVLKKPLLIAEFGKSSWSTGYTVQARDAYFKNIFNMAYERARKDGSCSGTTFWQVMAKGMESWDDGYQVVLEETPSTAAVIARQSQKISSLNSSKKI